MKARASVKDIDWEQGNRLNGLNENDQNLHSDPIDSNENEETTIPGIAATISEDGNRIAITQKSTTIFLGKGLRRSNYDNNRNVGSEKGKPIAGTRCPHAFPMTIHRYLHI
jgi:hypothetical protein